MPPANRARPTTEERAYVQRWLQRERDAEANEARRGQQFPYALLAWLVDNACIRLLVWALWGAVGVACAPVVWVLNWEATRREASAWAHEGAKVKTAAAVTMRAALPLPDDIEKWRLDCFRGRQIWFVHDTIEGHTDAGETTEAPRVRVQDHIERTHTGRGGSDSTTATSVDDAVDKAAAYVGGLQSGDGHWSNDYGGPMFLLPGLVIAKYIMYEGDQAAMFPEDARREMVRYIKNVQNTDGGWGLSEEGLSTMFGSVMNYVALRLLGVSAMDTRAVEARAFIQKHGGAVGIPTWGKCWLTLINLYQWDGIKPVLPELWLLPKWLVVNPGRLWCHTRMVYIPVGYLFGVKYQAPVDDLLRALRGEIYPPDAPFDAVDWDAAYAAVSPLDVHYPTHPVTLALFKILRCYERYVVPHCGVLRRAALRECLKHIEYDDVSTNFICLGPVNKVFNLLAMHAAQGMSEHVRLSEARLNDYLWLGKNGMKMNGYNGSQLWDTAFALQAYKACGKDGRGEDAPHADVICRGLEYIADAQVLERFPRLAYYNRDDPYGAYNFSTAEQGWQVSDCTAEGLRVAIVYDSLPTDRIRAGVDQVLSLRNADDGAWCSYEPRRSPTYLELLNPADVFTRIMVEYTYTECSSACMQTLRRFIESRHFSGYRRIEILAAMRAGAALIKRMQYPHGGWYGNWGVCFTYGTMFGIEGLLSAGEPKTCVEIRRAVAFLLSKQRLDGGWAEHVHTCASRVYTEPAGVTHSFPVQTAFALLGLTAAADAGSSSTHLAAMDRAAAFLVRTQRGGTWSQPAICGVFNGTCGIHYPFYPVVMPFWALAHYQRFKADPKAHGVYAARHEAWMELVRE